MLDPLESIRQIHAIAGLVGGSGTHGGDKREQFFHIMDLQETRMLQKPLRSVLIKQS